MKFRAFSIAEAMIVLLIVSVAMAASAPLLTKKAKGSFENNDLLERVQNLEAVVGARGNIQLFYSNGCPDGWEPVSIAGAETIGQHYLRLTVNEDELGHILEPSLPNITGGFPGVGQFYGNEKPKAYYPEDDESDGLFGALYRISNVNQPKEGVKVGNGEAQRDDYFGFNAQLANSIYGFMDDPATTDVDESATEVRPRSFVVMACKKI